MVNYLYRTATNCTTAKELLPFVYSLGNRYYYITIKIGNQHKIAIYSYKKENISLKNQGDRLKSPFIFYYLITPEALLEDQADTAV